MAGGHKVALKGRQVAVKHLLEIENINRNAEDPDEHMPLPLASEYSHKALVSLLLMMDGVKSNCKDKSDQRPLLRASSCGY
jgi:ankyrin repeat protein